MASNILATIYRPGSVLPTAVFFKELSAFVELLTTFAAPVNIAGDINIHLNRVGDPDADRFNVILKTFNMVQHVSSPTHEICGLLDAAITGEGHPPKDIEVEEV